MRTRSRTAAAKFQLSELVSGKHGSSPALVPIISDFLDLRELTLALTVCKDLLALLLEVRRSWELIEGSIDEPGISGLCRPQYVMPWRNSAQGAEILI